MLYNISRFIFSAALSTVAVVSFAQTTPLLHTKALADIPTLDEDKSVWFKMEEKGFEELRNTTAPLLSWEVQLPGEGLVEITLLKSCPFPMFIPVGERVDDGAGGVKVVERDFTTDLITYDLTGPGIGGSMVVFDNYLIASIRYKDRLFELRPTELKTTDITSVAIDYVLFDVNDSRGDSHFSCAADDIAQEKVEKIASQKSMVLECVEIAIDIDKYTYDTFGDCDAAINWSLAILAGVDEIYRTSMNDMVTLQASYINIWLTTDPYASYVENAGSMLDALRSTWLNDATLNSSNHDLIHLMTKRGNTGTGGIAWLDGLCNSYGVAFSAYMDNNTNFNIPSYNWNLNVVGHEIGHNFGASHTHWCGWPGGPIDNCGDLEGSCSGYTNNPTGQLGTMMSYCHAIGGGSVTLAFHQIVIDNALVPGANSASCIGTCAGTVYSCGGGYGCTDATACNYDPEAIYDNGNCAEYDICDICGGDGSSCSGCTNPIACNYNPSVTIDDGSCIIGGVEITFTILTDNYPGETTWNVADASGTVVMTGGPYSSSGTTYSSTVCVDNGCYDLTINDSYGDGICCGWGTGNYVITSQGATLVSGGEFASTETVNFCVSGDTAGCTDSNACNYNPAANVDDGSCEYSSCAGCTDSTACNYDSTATLDDGSCLVGGCMIPTACNFDEDAGCQLLGSCDYSSCAGCTDSTACNYDSTATIDDEGCEYESCACPNDLNGDGAITVADILIVLSEFNCLTNCTADVDDDGAVTVTDVLALLAAFGQSC
ncbi:MAG: M12 family metallo-peptidase [Bacteroidetes bacterium]|nr:M12 family metallo-peptidase [Bacteroidota bacterium]MDA0981407.1 M12 family metallo-peptidase [Bacteroidota bacterium]